MGPLKYVYTDGTSLQGQRYSVNCILNLESRPKKNSVADSAGTTAAKSSGASAVC